MVFTRRSNKALSLTSTPPDETTNISNKQSDDASDSDTESEENNEVEPIADLIEAPTTNEVLRDYVSGKTHMPFWRVALSLGMIGVTAHFINEARLIYGWNQLGVWTGYTFIGTFLIEHYRRTCSNPVLWTGQCPSYYLNKLNTDLWVLFFTLGTYWTTLSGLIHSLQIEKVFNTLTILIKPLVKISVSWISFGIGYFTEMSGYKYPVIVALGSLGLGWLSYYGKNHMTPEMESFLWTQWEYVSNWTKGASEHVSKLQG